jgi:hypothetical protein
MAEGDDLRQFIREITTRHERVLRDLIAELRGLRVDVDDLREASRTQTRALQATVEENREEHRAQREALFRILDRLQNGGAQA